MVIQMKREFESETCGRCGGTGTYSFCTMWGTTCFQCGTAKGVPGSGRRLTKRGAAARKFYESLMPRKAVAALIPGDKVRAFDAGSRGQYTVVEVRPSTGRCWVNGVEQPAGLDVQCAKVTYAGLNPEQTVSMIPTVAQADAAYAEALAYQATLTVKGVPAKRRAAAQEGK